MKTNFLITGLLMLILANLMMAYSMNKRAASASAEGFMNMLADSAAATGSGYQPMGRYDGIAMKPEHGLSGWRNTAPNEPLLGPEFKVDNDNLFIFKNNQCKPECCGASVSCDGGCVCTTPGQRQYIASRGGNRSTEDI